MPGLGLQGLYSFHCQVSEARLLLEGGSRWGPGLGSEATLNHPAPLSQPGPEEPPRQHSDMQELVNIGCFKLLSFGAVCY